MHENRLNSLKSEQERVNARLSKLYDLKLDGEVAEDMFRAKEEEYKHQLIEIKSEIDSSKAMNPNCVEDGSRALELSNRLYSLYYKADYEEKAKLLKLVASNYILNDVSISPTYRKPFDLMAKGLSRSNWLPLSDEIRNYFKGTMVI